MTEPIACNLSAFSEPELARHREVTAQLQANTLTTRELPNGYSFRHPVELLPLVAEFIARERLCCPFFTFTLHVQPDSELWLDITGTEDAKIIIGAEFVAKS